ncbi:transcriptional regulator [Lysinibacillus sp. MHQ-1]|nr:transcriptional regulator [Lysinibacillus sp. MHQ-1]
MKQDTLFMSTYCKRKKTVTVQHIADQFSIHPNVARLHLTKLSEINIISADYVKTGKGGRPGRVYKASEKGVSLSFPRRDEDRLLKWTIQLVEELGPSVLEKCQEISYQDGYQQMKQNMNAELTINNSLSFDEKLQLLTDNAALIGYVPQIQQTEHGKKGDILHFQLSIPRATYNLFGDSLLLT